MGGIDQEAKSEITMFENIKSNWQLQNLVRDIRSTDKDQVSAALSGLTAFVSDPRAFEAIVEVSGHADPELREEAIKILIAIGGDAVVEPLVVRLRDSNDRVRSAAARGLGDLADIKDFKPFKDALSSRDAFIRGVAARTLGKLAVKDAVPLLINALTDSEKEIRKIVAKALYRLGEQRWQRMVSGDDADYQRLGASGDTRIIEPLLKALVSPFPAIRNSVAAGLVQMKRPDVVVPALVAMLGDRNPIVRKTMIETLGKVGDKRAMEALIYCLDDQDKTVSAAAVEALDKLDQGAG